MPQRLPIGHQKCNVWKAIVVPMKCEMFDSSVFFWRNLSPILHRNLCIGKEKISESREKSRHNRYLYVLITPSKVSWRHNYHEIAWYNSARGLRQDFIRYISPSKNILLETEWFQANTILKLSCDKAMYTFPG